MLPPVEAWGRATRRLTDQQAGEIAGCGLLRVEHHPDPGTWTLIADSRVGVACGSGWEERVVPRIAIPKLTFLLGYALDPKGWKDIVAPMGQEADFFRAIASGFAWHAQRALAPGPLRGYHLVEETAVTVRGRMLVAPSIARHSGLPLPLEIAYDDYTVDIQENRMLLGAATALLRSRWIADTARRRLAHIRATLADVTPPTDVSVPRVTRLNQHYGAAITLAGLILRRMSITATRGRVASVAFIFDMNQVFEDFLSAALTEALREYGGSVRLQYPVRFLDKERRLRLKPDITWWASGRVRAVVDAKYKALEDARFPNADAYQMLAYCQAFGVDRGTLVYAKDALGADRTHSLPRGEQLRVVGLDLEREPAEIMDQVRGLAAQLASETAAPQAA